MATKTASGGGSRHLEDPSRHRGQTFAAVSERPRAELAAAGIRDSDVMRFRGPVDPHEPVALVLHRADPHAVGAAAMPTIPCTGAQGRRLPTGPSSLPLAGARVPPGARSTGGGWLLPASWPDPNSLRQLNPDHDERYRGGDCPPVAKRPTNSVVSKPSYNAFCTTPLYHRRPHSAGPEWSVR